MAMPYKHAPAFPVLPGEGGVTRRVFKQLLRKGAYLGRQRYSYVIRQAAALHEVGVDAKTGKILENRSEAASTKD